jgi:hypothetical protein
MPAANRKHATLPGQGAALQLLQMGMPITAVRDKRLCTLLWPCDARNMKLGMFKHGVTETPVFPGQKKG